MSQPTEPGRKVCAVSHGCCVPAGSAAGAGSGLSASSLLPSSASIQAAVSTCRADPWHPTLLFYFGICLIACMAVCFLFSLSLLGVVFFLFRFLFCLLSLHIGCPCFSRCRILKYELKKLCKCCCESPETSLEDLSC